MNPLVAELLASLIAGAIVFPLRFLVNKMDAGFKRRVEREKRLRQLRQPAPRWLHR